MCGKRSPKMKIAGNLRFFFSLFVGSQGIYVGIGYMSRNPYYLQIQYVLQTVCFVCFFCGNSLFAVVYHLVTVDCVVCG